MPTQRRNIFQSTILSGYMVPGAFGIGAAGAVNAALNRGRGFSVEKESADGQYTLTFDGPIANIIAVQAQLEGTLDDIDVQTLSIDIPNRQVVLQLKTAGVAANAASGDVVTFQAVFAAKSTD